MRTGLRVVTLLAGYSLIGFGGDYAVGLLAQDQADDVGHVRHAAGVLVDVEADVVVDVKQAIVARVQIRHSGACDFELEREVTIQAGGVDLLHIDAGAGALHVEGREGLEEIVAVGMVCASEEEDLDALQLTVERSVSGDVTLVAHYPEQRGWGGRSHRASIDLTVLMPLGLNVDIEDSSGEMNVSGTGSLSIDDSSGSIRVSDVNGSLHIDDSSGGIVVRDVSGDMSLEDGSGGIEILNVGGTLRLSDGSGGIEVSNIGEDFVVDRDGSGGIEVSDVGGDFIVDRDGSGGIRHSGVQGRVEIPVRRRRRRGD